jgi:hypothetical protein
MRNTGTVPVNTFVLLLIVVPSRIVSISACPELPATTTARSERVKGANRRVGEAEEELEQAQED